MNEEVQVLRPLTSQRYEGKGRDWRARMSLDNCYSRTATPECPRRLRCARPDMGIFRETLSWCSVMFSGMSSSGRTPVG